MAQTQQHIRPSITPALHLPLGFPTPIPSNELHLFELPLGKLFTDDTGVNAFAALADNNDDTDDATLDLALPVLDHDTGKTLEHRTTLPPKVQKDLGHLVC